MSVLKLGISLDSIVGENYDVTHEIGKYAYRNEYNGIIAPSARTDDNVMQTYIEATWSFEVIGKTPIQ